VSAENLELVRELYRRIEADGSFPDDLLDDEIEYVNPPDAVEPGTRRGREAFHAAIARVDDAFGERSVELEEIVDGGDDVVALLTFVVRGSASGLERRQPQGHVWTFRDGKATRFSWFNDPAAALAAAGLSAKEASAEG
jgi:ketosteroid isomerase-like protein